MKTQASGVQPASAVVRVRDAGLQAERTALAWSRTALAILTNGVLVLRAGWAGEKGAITFLAFALLLAAAATFRYSMQRRRELDSAPRPSAPPAAVTGAVAVAAVGACCVGLATLLTRALDMAQGSAQP